MGIFGKGKKKEPESTSLVGVPVGDVVDDETFTDSTWQGKETSFRILRFVEAYSPDSLRGRFGKTHLAIVCRTSGKKEYEALLTIEGRRVVKSFVDKFYG
ncbi:MAG: hypothetical protein EB101_09920 [Chitinophagia bacterium]|nr:hypothetical protein [Chitinophagia bacterium]